MINLKPYIISLKNVDEKITYLNQLGINNIQFISGVDVKKTEPDAIKEAVNKYLYQFLPDSVIGCAMAHMNTWKEFLNSDYDYALIMEDDVMLEPNMDVNNIYQALSMTPNDFDILYLGCFLCNENNYINSIHKFLKLMVNPTLFNPITTCKEKIINSYIKQPIDALGLHCYILSKKGAQTLLDKLYGKVYNHIDGCINYIITLKKYSVIENIASQTSVTYKTFSNNVTENNHPMILNYISNKIHVAKDIPLKYLLDVKLFKVGTTNINTTSIIFLLIGIILSFLKIELKYIIIGFVFLSIQDFIINPRNVYIYLNMFLIILPTLLSTLPRNVKKSIG